MIFVLYKTYKWILSYIQKYILLLNIDIYTDKIFDTKRKHYLRINMKKWKIMGFRKIFNNKSFDWRYSPGRKNF